MILRQDSPRLIWEAGHLPYLGRRLSGRTERSKRHVPVPLCQAPPGGVRQELVMVIVRHRVAQEGLQQPVNVRGAEEILAPRDKRDVLEIIVHGDAEMIAGRHILAGQHHIAEIQRRRLDASGGAVAPI